VRVHDFTPETEGLAHEILDYALGRQKLFPVPLDAPRPYSELWDEAGETITEQGIGGHRALEIFRTILAPACISTDHPRYLAFIPSAPTEYATLFDLVVSATALYGGSWLEGAGAVYAENQALRWICDLVGFGEHAGGVFVQGGTLGNLSALVTARAAAARVRGPQDPPRRWAIACSTEAHSSVHHAATVMDVDVVLCPADSEGRLIGAQLRSCIERYHDSGAGQIFAIVASAGTTNLGIVDDLESVSAVAKETGIWLHVDGAYGGAALAAPSKRAIFAGIENADSFIVDPHKWLFAPFDACALVYRDPAEARMTHAQHASYLDPLQHVGEWNPSDYAVHLTRRARGLPFWFSLSAHGTAAYAEAIEHTLALTSQAADLIRQHPSVELVCEPTLSVVAFRRLGWTRAEYESWSDRLLQERIAFVTPSTHKGEPILRFAIVNPRTTIEDIETILDTLL
jgi:glutamate/tyrosine decarboxylase-like PLP-dependent enzyme